MPQANFDQTAHQVWSVTAGSFVIAKDLRQIVVQRAHYVYTASFQRWINIKDVESTLKRRCFNVVCLRGQYFTIQSLSNVKTSHRSHAFISDIALTFIFFSFYFNLVYGIFVARIRQKFQMAWESFCNKSFETILCSLIDVVQWNYRTLLNEIIRHLKWVVSWEKGIYCICRRRRLRRAYPSRHMT